MLLTYFLFCGFIIEPTIHSHNLRAKKKMKMILVDCQVIMLCVPKVDGVENEESMWKHSPKSKVASQVRLLLLPNCVPSYNFFRNFLAKSFVVSIIIVTFAVSYLAESSRWAKAGWTYIHKGVTVRFGFDVSESRKFNLSVKNKATGTPHGVYHIYSPY